MKLAEISLRDPFVLCDGSFYYLYGTRSSTAWGNADGFDVYKSADLKHWSTAKEIFHNDGTFWATHSYWAPECIHHNGTYYLITTFGGKEHKKGIQFLKSSFPDGNFEPVTEKPITPPDWECLDGTFYQDHDGKPYLIFSHGIPEETRGAICAAPLHDDFSGISDEPHVLFYADEAPWTRPIPFAKQEFGIEGDAYFSDGPFVIQRGNELFLLWSSWSTTGYAMGIAKSESGTLFGSWQHQKEAAVKNGGHGMVFTANDGTRFLTFHSPNERGKEHPVFLDASNLCPFLQ